MMRLCGKGVYTKDCGGRGCNWLGNLVRHGSISRIMTSLVHISRSLPSMNQEMACKKNAGWDLELMSYQNLCLLPELSSCELSLWCGGCGSLSAFPWCISQPLYFLKLSIPYPYPQHRSCGLGLTQP